jgi:hypothetical protein
MRGAALRWAGTHLVALLLVEGAVVLAQPHLALAAEEQQKVNLRAERAQRAHQPLQSRVDGMAGGSGQRAGVQGSACVGAAHSRAQRRAGAARGAKREAFRCGAWRAARAALRARCAGGRARTMLLLAAAASAAFGEAATRGCPLFAQATSPVCRPGRRCGMPRGACAAPRCARRHAPRSGGVALCRRSAGCLIRSGLPCRRAVCRPLQAG